MSNTDNARVRAGIYTDLDTLFDTRAGLACLLDKNNEEFIKNKKYKYRLRDNMGNVSSQIFNTFYRNRNKNLFQLAIPTPILDEVIRIDYEELMTITSELNTGKIPIYVNIYPYNFTEEELSYFKYTILRICTGANIIFIKMDYSELTPEWIKSRVKRVYSYSGLDWLNYHSYTTKLFSDPMLDVMFIVPPIIDGSYPLSSIKKDTYINLSNSYSKLIDLNFIDTEYFCGIEYNLKKHDGNTTEG